MDLWVPARMLMGSICGGSGVCGCFPGRPCLDSVPEVGDFDLQLMPNGAGQKQK